MILYHSNYFEVVRNMSQVPIELSLPPKRDGGLGCSIYLFMLKFEILFNIPQGAVFDIYYTWFFLLLRVMNVVITLI